MKKLAWFAVMMVMSAALSAADLRIGIIGLDTSHVIAFTKSLDDPAGPDHVPGGHVVAVFKGGSPDLKSSAGRIDKFTAELQDTYKVKLVESIPALCGLVDAILLESVDGRVGIVRGLRKGKEDYGALLFREKDVLYVPAGAVSYVGLVREIMEFFKTGWPPVKPEETLEIMAFIDAAERSRQMGGVPVKITP